MTDNEKVFFLSRYRVFQNLFDRQWAAVEDLQAQQGRITADYSPRVGTHGGSIYHDREVDLISKIVAKKDEAMKTLNLALDALEELRAVIKQLPVDLPMEVLELRYMTDKTWADIAAELELSDAYVYKLHHKALDQVVIP